MQYIHSELLGLYPENEIRSFSFLIVESLTGFSRTQILITKNTHFSDEQRAKVIEFVDKLKKHVPIQYILGETEFYGLRFEVDDAVLIPRPETEELVEWITTENRQIAELKILDIGTGSGCIAISLKNNIPNSTIDAFDISESALKTARRNADLNNAEISFSRVDILSNPAFDKKWDIIVSNPPYIPEVEKSEIHSNVLDHEPHLALFVPDNDPLLFYRKIAEFAQKQLTVGGRIYFEIHRNGGESTVQLLSEMGFSTIELRKDISANNRMIRAFYNLQNNDSALQK